MRTRECDAAVRAGRMGKAERFFEAAASPTALDDEAKSQRDAIVTLHVTAGIAAADVICCAVLRRYSAGDDHADAVRLLGEADGSVAQHLSRLLALKSKAAYTHRSVSAADGVVAERAARALLVRARAL